jgi:hypothetical protein
MKEAEPFSAITNGEVGGHRKRGYSHEKRSNLRTPTHDEF